MAKKYIDAEKVIAKIQRLNSLVPYDRNDRHDDGLHDAYKAVVDFIDSLPEPQSIDFETEYAKFHLFGPDDDPEDFEDYTFPIDLADYKEFARHFYALGKNSK